MVVTLEALALKISVSKDFSRYPGGRFAADGKFSGEEFRDRILVPALKAAKRRSEQVVVNLDDTAGYASSFLEETFGGLVRVRGFSAKELLGGLLRIEAKNPLYAAYKVLAEKYIRDAEPLARAG